MPRGGRREGAGSGGQRDGAGRPRKQWNSGGRGALWVMERSVAPGALPDKPRMWQVLSVDEDGTIEFQDVQSEMIYVLRLPDEESDDDGDGGLVITADVHRTE